MSPKTDARGSLWDILAIVFLSMVIIPTAMAMLVDLVFRLNGIAPTAASLKYVKMVSVVSAQEVALFLLTIGSMSSTGWSMATLRLFSPRRWQDILCGVGLGFVLIGVNLAGEHLSRLFFGLFMDEGRVLALLSEENAVTIGLVGQEYPQWVRVVMAILIIVVAPIVEETFFRGYVYNTFKARLGSLGALFTSSLLFAAVHMYVIHFLPIFALGLVLALLYERRRALVVPIVAHSMMNLLVALALYFLRV